MSVDMDGVVTDFNQRVIDLVHELAPELNWGLDQWTTYKLSECLPPEVNEAIQEKINSPGFFRDLPPIPGAVEGLQYLVDFGWDVSIVSSPPWQNDLGASEKIVWCAEHLPFLHRKKVNLIHDKHKFYCDVGIDDMPGKMEKYHRLGRRVFTVLYPYNRQAAATYAEVIADYRQKDKIWHTFIDHLIHTPARKLHE